MLPGERKCATKVDEERFAMTEKYTDEAFGFCHHNCNGEVLQPESKFNLALVRILNIYNLLGLVNIFKSVGE